LFRPSYSVLRKYPGTAGSKERRRILEKAVIAGGRFGATVSQLVRAFRSSRVQEYSRKEGWKDSA